MDDIGIWSLILAMGIPTAVTGFCFWLLQRSIQKRDKAKELPIDLPKNYFPNNNANLPPSSYWRSTAHLFFANWLNYYVYQETPYDFT